MVLSKATSQQRRNNAIIASRDPLDISKGVDTCKIILLGGEPTTHPDLLEIIRYASPVETALLTNGIAFANKEYCRRIAESGLSIVSTSLKGTSEQEYAEHCGKSAYARVLSGIENLEASGMRHQVSITVCYSTIKNWAQMLQTIRNCGARDFTFSFERPVVSGDTISLDEHMLPSHAAHFIETEMYPSLCELGVKFDINLTFPHCHFSAGFVEKANAEGHAVAGCQLLTGNGIIFDPQGQVLACNHLTDHPLGKYGHDFSTASELLAWRNSPDMKRFYEFASAPPVGQCKGCAEWCSCGAGCRIFWLHKGADTLLARRECNH